MEITIGGALFRAHPSIFDDHEFYLEVRERGAYLTRDQARQLRDELTSFLGEKEGINGMALVAWTALNKENEKLRADIKHLDKRVAEEFLQINDRDRKLKALRAENEKLRQRVASLEKDNRDLRLSTADHEVESAHLHAIMEGFIDDAKSLLLYFRGTTE